VDSDGLEEVGGRRNRDYDDYHKRTARNIPVMILSPR
jgi:hypothetical protein